MRIWLIEPNDDARDTMAEECRLVAPDVAVDAFDTDCGACHSSSRPDLIVAHLSRLGNAMNRIAAKFPAVPVYVYSGALREREAPEDIARLRRVFGIEQLHVVDMYASKSWEALIHILGRPQRKEA
jgi:hypothetical protein